MSVRNSYKNLYKELVRSNKRLFESVFAERVQKNEAILKYEKLNLERSGKPAEEIAEIIAMRKKRLDDKLNEEKRRDARSRFVNSLKLSEDYRNLVKRQEAEHAANVLDTVALFLRSQRQYSELLEKYNPGLSMTQEERVKKTANRVGLQVPEGPN